MKKDLTIILGCIVFGLIGCTMPETPQNENPKVETPQNIIRWVSNRNSSRATNWQSVTLDEVTIEIYKVPVRNSTYMHKEKELIETILLHRGEEFLPPSVEGVI